VVARGGVNGDFSRRHQLEASWRAIGIVFFARSGAERPPQLPSGRRSNSMPNAAKVAIGAAEIEKSLKFSCRHRFFDKFVRAIRA